MYYGRPNAQFNVGAGYLLNAIALELAVCAIRGKSECRAQDNGEKSALRQASKPNWSRIVWNEGDRNYNEIDAKEYEKRKKEGGMGFNGNKEHCVDTFDSDVCGACLSVRAGLSRAHTKTRKSKRALVCANAPSDTATLHLCSCVLICCVQCARSCAAIMRTP
jgi:hypothetical protein